MRYACKFCVAMKGLKGVDVPTLPIDEVAVLEHIVQVHGYTGANAREILGAGEVLEMAANLIEATGPVLKVTAI